MSEAVEGREEAQRISWVGVNEGVEGILLDQADGRRREKEKNL